MENKSCAIDAIQVINGCTYGKGNLIFKDYGKHVYTYFKRSEKKALRVSLKPDVLPQEEKHTALFAKVKAGIASPNEAKEFRNLQEEKSQKILDMPDDELFWVREIEIEPPEKL